MFHRQLETNEKLFRYFRLLMMTKRDDNDDICEVQQRFSGLGSDNMRKFYVDRVTFKR